MDRLTRYGTETTLERQLILACEDDDYERVKNLLVLHGGDMKNNRPNNDHHHGDGDGAAMLYHHHTPSESSKISIDVNCMNMNDLDKTPLHYSCDNMNYKMTKLLLQYHANPNVIIVTGWTPLGIVSYHGNLAMTELLLRYGADPNIEERCGGRLFRPLFLACRRGHDTIVSLLLRHQANVNSINEPNLGRTPIFDAIVRQHYNIIIMLLHHRASIYIKDHDMMTPYEFAIQQSYRPGLRKTEQIIAKKIVYQIEMIYRRHQTYTSLLYSPLWIENKLQQVQQQEEEAT